MPETKTKPSDPTDSVDPKHIAIIMDGNGRWAKQRGMPRPAGHRAGVKSVRRMVESCRERGIAALTLFAFSSENWRRPITEVNLLMELFISTLKKEVKDLHRNNVRVEFIGECSAFNPKLQKLIEDTETLTAENTGLRLSIAVNYGGRWDIVNAAQQLAKQVASGQLSVDEINEQRFHQEVALADVPEPDLFIRTGGERRISNYLLWQLAYTELFFTDTLWPDFDDGCLSDAIDWYRGRQRRFGRTGDQVEQVKGA